MSGSINYYYTAVAPRPRFGGVSTSRQEVSQILIAFTVFVVALVFIFTGSAYLYSGPATLASTLTPAILAAAVSAGLTGFVAHELAHKIVAQRRGAWAEFRMWPMGLVFTFLTSVTAGMLLGAPGATMVAGMSESDRTGWGTTSVAGPLTNVTFGLGFLAVGLGAFRLGVGASSVYWILMIAWINGLFGTFNLLPVGPLDGRKVLRWSVPVWLGSILFTGTVAAISVLGAYSTAAFGTPFHCYQAVGGCL